MVTQSFITRHKVGKKFGYRGTKQEDIERIKKLRIPPMWTNVKIDPSTKSKIQATGYDSKNRKQYIYHKDFIEKTKNLKFKKMNTFDYAKYSRVIKHYMNKCNLSKECVIANVIKIMEDLNIRVGNESYKKENGSYGITTLLKKHVHGNTLSFIGKKGIKHTKFINNEKSKSFIKKVLNVKGPNLFYDSTGGNITSSDLNNFLKTKVQTNITCKDLRTYCANKIFLNFMNKLKIPSSETDKKKNINLGIDHTANELGNTRKICRDSYISPKNINKYI
jgi:DNA topoisomerase I